MRLVKASEMQEMDRLTIHELGIPGVVLMENAARGATRIFLEHFDPMIGSRVLILCGSGNNGGDGYVMARYLHNAGMDVEVAVLSKISKISDDALINLDIIGNMGLKVSEISGLDEWSELNAKIGDYDYIIDGILGTGLNSDVRGFLKEVIEGINRAEKKVMSIDIPSGLNSDTGQVMGSAIVAELTVTFGFPKLGQLLFPGADYVGRMSRIDIGIPRELSDQLPLKHCLIEPEDFIDHLISNKRDIHKGSRGHLLVLAGSVGKTGAAALTAMGALRAGAGLVTLCVPKSLNHILEAKLTEAMTVPMPETRDGSLSLDAEKKIRELIEGKTALAVGPGLSTDKETCALVRNIVRDCHIPMVIDADGINNLAGDLDALSGSADKKILTPHPGEMSRLTGLKKAEIQANRIGVAADFADTHGCYLVLKGARTVVAEPDGMIHLNATGNPLLSSGGSGDVLTGLISGFVARGLPLAKAAVAGVYIHGLAADFLSDDLGQAGVLAGELADTIPNLMACLAGGEWPLLGLPPYIDLYQPL